MAHTTIHVDTVGDWGGDPVRAPNITFSVRVEGGGSEKDLTDLVRHTDEVAEIHNSLRLGTKVTLGRAEAVST